MKKAEVIAAVRRVYPTAEAARIPEDFGFEIVAERHALAVRDTEYAAWCEALRYVTREQENLG